MIVKKIINICKKSKNIFLYENGDEQWISDGIAFYPLYGLPRFNESTLYQTYDITDNQQNKIRFRHESKLPTTLCFDDVMPGEVVCDQCPVGLSSADHGIVPYMTSEGIVFIDASYLAPLANTREGMLGIYERFTPSGQRYFAAKSGFMLLALISPYDCINENFVKNLEILHKQCEVALFNKRSRENKAATEQEKF